MVRSGLFMAAFAAVSLSLPVLAQSAYEARLTAADVATATGEMGVESVTRGSRPGAGGDLNFVRADGKLLLMVTFGDARLYSRARTPRQVTIGSSKSTIELFAHAVSGVGDEAFASPPGAVQYVIYARKANTAIAVSTYFARDGKTALLTEAQLTKIAALILSRE